MTDTITTTSPSATVPTSPTGTPSRRRRAAILAACLGFAAIAGATALIQRDGADGTAVPAEHTAAPSGTGLTMSPDAYARWAAADALSSGSGSALGSADAMERQAEAEGRRQAEGCRSTASAPDAVERCLASLAG